MRFLRLSCVLILAGAALASCDKPKPRTPAAPAAGEAPAPARMIPAEAIATPAAPTWAQPLIGKLVTEAFPKTSKCIGNTDIVQKTYSGTPAGVQIHGWGWQPDAKAKVEKIVLVDKDQKIVGAGAGGVPRPDVTAAGVGVTVPDAGWNADAPVTSGPLAAYGVTADDTACALGRVEF